MDRSGSSDTITVLFEKHTSFKPCNALPSNKGYPNPSTMYTANATPWKKNENIWKKTAHGKAAKPSPCGLPADA
jgi:hypothetical protein